MGQLNLALTDAQKTDKRKDNHGFVIVTHLAGRKENVGRKK